MLVWPFIFGDNCKTMRNFTPELRIASIKKEELTFKNSAEKMRRVYRHGYQGEFTEKDAETGCNHSAYLGMGNDPVNGVDPDGGLFLVDDFYVGF